MKGGVAAFFRFTAGALVVALLAAGIPLLWIWIGSQVQGGTAPSATAIATVVTGCMASYGFVAMLAAYFKGRGDEVARKERRERYAWNRSLRDEAKQAPKTNFLENCLIATTIVVAVVVTVWFFLYGSPGVPIAP